MVIQVVPLSSIVVFDVLINALLGLVVIGFGAVVMSDYRIYKRTRFAIMFVSVLFGARFMFASMYLGTVSYAGPQTTTVARIITITTILSILTLSFTYVAGMRQRKRSRNGS